MNNKFLEELATKPIVNTFKLSFQLFWSNKLLFIVMTGIFIFLSVLPFLIPFVIGQVSIMLIGIIMSIISVASQVFMESNYLYICKILLESHDEEGCVEKMTITKVSLLFTRYIVRALGSSLAIFLIVMPFILIGEQLSMGEYWDMFLLVLLILALYIYPLVVHKTTLSKNFKEAFLVTFLLFSPVTWKQSFNVAYAKFVIVMMIILSGLFYILSFTIDNLPTTGNIYMLLMPMVIMTIFIIFIMLYVFPVALMIAQSLIAKK